MRPDRAKQLLKNGLYRTIGETATTIGAVDGDGDRALRVLMYHKVNDRPENPISVPIGLFDEQMAVLRELGYQVVSLDDVLDHVAGITPLPPGAVLITFDDGYRDILENALPVLRRHGYPAVIFVPIGYLDDARPLPHEEHLAAEGLVNPTLSWDELPELEAGGIRVESHGISHRPLADLDVDEAAREITLSKLRLEERLGRPVRAFAYVKGSEAHYRPVHLSLLKQAGYEIAFTSVSGGNRAEMDPLRLHRYNIEPYAHRTFELVLAGACDLIGVKDTVAGTHARRIFNQALGTATK
ncbi:MAG: polysaccharide deacetylase family protein [Gaiellaceae bacterium]